MIALPHDGWSSRKLLLAVAILGSLEVIATVALFLGRASFGEWASFAQLLVPGVLVPLFGALGVDKLAEARAAAAQVLE